MRKLLIKMNILGRTISIVVALFFICFSILATNAFSQNSNISSNPGQAFSDWINAKNYLDNFCEMRANPNFYELGLTMEKKYRGILGDQKFNQIGVGQTLKFNMGQVKRPSDKSQLLSNCSALIQVAKIYAESIGYDTNFLSQMEQNLINKIQ